MQRMIVLAVVGTLCCSTSAHSADSPTNNTAGLELFEKSIRPVLVERCYECHSAQLKSPKGGLRLDSRAAWQRGDESGAVVVPGQPDKSRLLQALEHRDEVSAMPPDGKLSAAVIDDFRRWIALGAPDPREETLTPVKATDWATVVADRQTWWSWQPRKRHALPQVDDPRWQASAIDRWIATRLTAAGLTLPPRAERAELLRRLHLVLTGLPPSTTEVRAFTTSGQPLEVDVAAVVDKLLASTAFGERWARHWLDVMRFSETHGNEWNYEVHHAWRYRDYCIRALNDDLPFDQFVREHIAGDRLPPRLNERERFNEAVIGTACYRFGEVNHDDCIGLKTLGYDALDNQIDTLTKAFQATTVACARCHDHKLDAVSMKDYYALLGVIRSARPVAHTIDEPSVNAEPRQRLEQLGRELQRELASVWKREAGEIERYMLACQPNAGEPDQTLDPARLKAWRDVLIPEGDKSSDKPIPWDEPFAGWRRLTAATKSGEAVMPAWYKLAHEFDTELKRRSTLLAEQYAPAFDFRNGAPRDWQADGQGLLAQATPAGRVVWQTTGDELVQSVFPAGLFTHTLSSKFNGALRSPPLGHPGKKLSLRVLGDHGAAVRLVSNNCQLNYKNYRALTGGQLTWVTFTFPAESDELRTYVELMTMWDNPKFPDQLATLGGDKRNYRVPVDEAFADPRSYWGVTQAVWHDANEPPPASLSFVEPVMTRSKRDFDAVHDYAQLAERYGSTIRGVVTRWLEQQTTDDDAVWLDYFMRHKLLTNRLDASPKIAELAQEYRAVEASLTLPRVVPGMAESGVGYDQPLLVRGDCQRPGEIVSRGYVDVLDGSTPAPASNDSGRLALAHNLSSADNPLTARVIVNRVWHHLFGQGIVRTVDDFGHLGDLPSHPELLDELAQGLIDDGWSLKRLIRRIVLSQTFQMSSQLSGNDRCTRQAHELDPDNRLLHHYSPRRLEAEAIRDAILLVAGNLRLEPYGPSVQPYRVAANADRRLFVGPLDGAGRRSIYIKVNLMESPKFLGVFNLPGGKVTQGRRDRSRVPAQSLALLNDPFVHDQAAKWGVRLASRKPETLDERLEHLFLTSLSRLPTPMERERWRAAINDLRQLHEVPLNDLLTSRAVWQDIAHALFNLEEFISIP